MSETSRLSEEPRRGRVGHSGRGKKLIRGAAALFAAVALLFAGRVILNWWATQMASREFHRGAVSAALRWLTYSAWLYPRDGATDVFRATCFRNLGEIDGWREALQSARQKGLPPERMQIESQLGSIQLGLLDVGGDLDLSTLMASTAFPHDVGIAMVHGYLANERPEIAKAVVDAWSADHPEAAHTAHMRGLYWCWFGETTRAEAEFVHALEREPRHELARAALAKMLEDRNWLGPALGQYAELAARFPENLPAHVGLARLLRKTGRFEDARAVLQSLGPTSDRTVLGELGQIDLDLGDCIEAESLFKRAQLDQVRDTAAYTAAATLVALRGEIPWAESLFAHLDARHLCATETYDLQVRIAADPSDVRVAEAYRRLPPLDELPFVDPPAAPSGRPAEKTGAELYALHCAACHGANGDGTGRAARHLYPRPRNLRTENSRLVSTLNGVPTLEDVEAVIQKGMPGASMPAFDKLSAVARSQLAQEALRLKREGVQSRFAKMLADEGEKPDTDELHQLVELHTKPTDVVRIPRMDAGDSRAIAGGKECYVAQGCRNCHGEDGNGLSDLPLFDEAELPTPARDLVHEPFKGGHEPESVGKRIAAGMPGSPHPSSPSLTEKQLAELVAYCCSLSQEPKRTFTNHERARRAADRALAKASGAAPAK